MLLLPRQRPEKRRPSSAERQRSATPPRPAIAPFPEPLRKQDLNSSQVIGSICVRGAEEEEARRAREKRRRLAVIEELKAQEVCLPFFPCASLNSTSTFWLVSFFFPE